MYKSAHNKWQGRRKLSGLTRKVGIVDQPEFTVDLFKQTSLARFPLVQTDDGDSVGLPGLALGLITAVVGDVLFDIGQAKLGERVDGLVCDGV